MISDANKPSMLCAAATIDAIACTPHVIRKSVSANMYTSSPMMMRKALEKDRFLLKLLLPGMLAMVSANRVPPRVATMNMNAMPSSTGTMPACWNRRGIPSMAGPTQLLVINAKDPRLSMDLMDFPGAALELLIVAPLLRIIAASISMEESVAAAAAVSDMD
jgi:hypothetical protein